MPQVKIGLCSIWHPASILTIKKFSSSIIHFLLLFSLIIAGLMSSVVSQSVVTLTRTYTSLETIQGATMVTTFIVEGDVKTGIVILPGYVLIGFMADSGRTCVLVFNRLAEIPEHVLTIAETILFPGMTFSIIYSEMTVSPYTGLTSVTSLHFEPFTTTYTSSMWGTTSWYTFTVSGTTTTATMTMPR